MFQGAEAGSSALAHSPVCLALVGGQHYMRVAALCWLLVLALHTRDTFRENLTLLQTSPPAHKATSTFVKVSQTIPPWKG